MRKFRKLVVGEVELLFLQQCGRASAENLYNFHDAATVVMASQMNVGAPNTYYVPLLEWLARTPNAAGIEVAQNIMKHDNDYHIYAAVDGHALRELPARLTSALSGISHHSQSLTRPRQVDPCFEYEGEANYDLIMWLQELLRENELPTSIANPLVDWLRESLVLALQIHPDHRLECDGFCGLSLYVPNATADTDTYQFLPFYVDTRIDRLWKLLE